MIDLETKSAEEAVVNHPTKGDRGVVGTASPSQTLKKLWHNAKKEGGANLRASLKTFAHRLLKEGNKTVEDWYACKRGDLNASRSDKNTQRIGLEAQATKAAKRKTGKK